MRNRHAAMAACLSLAAGYSVVARPASAQAPAVAAAPDTWVSRSAIYEVFVRDFSPNLRGDALVLVNPRRREISVGVTGFAVDGARDLLSNRIQHGDRVTLPAYGAMVLAV